MIGKLADHYKDFKEYDDMQEGKPLPIYRGILSNYRKYMKKAKSKDGKATIDRWYVGVMTPDFGYLYGFAMQYENPKLRLCSVGDWVLYQVIERAEQVAPKIRNRRFLNIRRVVGPEISEEAPFIPPDIVQRELALQVRAREVGTRMALKVMEMRERRGLETPLNFAARVAELWTSWVISGYMTQEPDHIEAIDLLLIPAQGICPTNDADKEGEYEPEEATEE